MMTMTITFVTSGRNVVKRRFFYVTSCEQEPGNQCTYLSLKSQDTLCHICLKPNWMNQFDDFADSNEPATILVAQLLHEQGLMSGG